MAYPAATVTLSKALDIVDTQAAVFKSESARYAKLFATDSTANQIGQMFDVISRARSLMTSAASTTGLAAYAQTQKGDNNLDVAAEYTAMFNAATAVLSWVADNIPKDVNGFAAVKMYDVDTGVTDRSFTAVQLASLVTLLNTLNATVA